jgi:hypothetical protein
MVATPAVAPTAAPSLSFCTNTGLHEAQTQVLPYWMALSLVNRPPHSTQVISSGLSPLLTTGGTVTLAAIGTAAEAVVNTSGRTVLRGCQLAMPSFQTRSAGLICPAWIMFSNWASSTGPCCCPPEA